MLKIKDNVDLKELEKFGFKLGVELSKDELYEDVLNEGTEYMYNWYHLMQFEFDEETNEPIRTYDNLYPTIHIIVTDNRKIIIDIMNNNYTYHNEGSELSFIENILYDLIKANLVEKVEE